MRSIPRKCAIVASLVAMGGWAATSRADLFTAGDLAVVRIGTGAAALTSASTATFIDEYTTAAGQTNPVLTVALPTVSVTNGNNALTNSGTATSEGALSLSANGQYLVLAGYDTTTGTAGVASTSSTSSNPGPLVLRDAATINSNGGINSTTTFGAAFSGNNIRGATSLDGTQIYAVGATSGVQYAVTGASTSTTISSTVANDRTVQIVNGQLYMSTGSGSNRGVYAVGTGVPTVTGVTSTLVAVDPAGATPVGSNSSPYTFTILGNNLYLADSNSLATGGGLEKFVSNGSGGYNYEYTITSGLTQGLSGLTGTTVSGTNYLYATTADGTLLLGTTDVAAATSLPGADTFSTLATAATNEVFRGVAFAPSAAPAGGPAAVPEPASLILLGLGGLGARWALRRKKPVAA